MIDFRCQRVILRNVEIPRDKWVRYSESLVEKEEEDAVKRLIRDILLIVIGSMLYAFSLTFLSIPNHLAEGGVSGVAILLYYAFTWSPGITNFIVNGFLLLIGYRFLPRRTVFLSLLTAPLISFFIFITEGKGEPLGDPLVAAIFAGVVIGIGTGMIFRAGSSMGGSTIVARMLNHNFGWELTGTNFVVDAIIVLAGLLVIGPLNTMYTVIALFIGKKATDFVIEGFDTKKAVHIVSTQAPKIADAIIMQMNTSATVFRGYGGYSKENKDMVYVVINKYQLFKLKQVISSVDNEAFVSIHDVRDVFGGSFSWLPLK